MKKILYFVIAAAALVFGATSCEKTSEGLTGITYYPVITLQGDSYMVVDKGSTFVDPGFTAELNGEDYSSEVTVNSNVDTSTSGVYSVSYSAINADGFAASVIRTVVVLDANDPVEGFYLVDPTSNRNGTKYGNYEVLIIGEGDGVYSVDDLLGGWYRDRAGYGDSYAMQGEIEVAEDGSVSLIDSYVPGWGDSADSFSDGSYDFDKNVLKYALVYAGTLNFNVILVKE